MMDFQIANLIIKLEQNSKGFSFFDGITIFISIIAVLFSIFTFLDNKNLTLKNEFIKREANVLLDYRKTYLKAQLAFYWFKDWLLTPKIYIHHVEEPLLVSTEELRNNFNLINDLNNMYNINQHIFDKQGLQKTCNLIAKFLDCFQGYHFNDIEMFKVKREDKYLEYRPVNFEQIVKTFLTNFQQDFIEDFEFKKDYDKFEQCRDIFFEDIADLEFKLDEITLYNSGKKKTERNLLIKKFFPDYKINKKQERTYSETLINEKANS